MAKDREKEPKRGKIRARIQSLRVQLGLMILLSYLVPVGLLGVFTGNILLNSLEKKTEAALTSGAEHAFTMTEENIGRAVELARAATYDGELTAAWEKWKNGTAGDAEFLQLCRGYLERKYSRESLFFFAGCFPLDKPEILISYRGSVKDPPAYLQQLHFI